MPFHIRHLPYVKKKRTVEVDGRDQNGKTAIVRTKKTAKSKRSQSAESKKAVIMILILEI